MPFADEARGGTRGIEHGLMDGVESRRGGSWKGDPCGAPFLVFGEVRHGRKREVSL